MNVVTILYVVTLDLLFFAMILQFLAITANIILYLLPLFIWKRVYLLINLYLRPILFLVDHWWMLTAATTIIIVLTSTVITALTLLTRGRLWRFTAISNTLKSGGAYRFSIVHFIQLTMTIIIDKYSLFILILQFLLLLQQWIMILYLVSHIYL